MHRRLIFKWILLATISIALIHSLLSLIHHDAVAAAIKPKAAQTQGSLQALDKNRKPAGQCPLKHTAVKAEISGSLSRVTVTQEFQNPFPDKIEAVYAFPLPQAAAVDQMAMVIGERTIKGKIMRKEEAQTAYSNARQLGQVASLLDQERPNIFTQSVANIMPGQEIQVTISYIETLKYDNGSYEWTFPMVVGPRYIPETTIGEDPMDTPVSDSSRITPPEAPEGMRAGHDISLELVLDAGVTIETLKSETHDTEVERSDTRRAVVRLKDSDVIPNKDFVLKYQVAGNRIEDAVLAHSSNQGGFFTLILQPPQLVSPEDVMPKELVFVLDTSGSMEGFPLTKSKETMKLALDNLYPHDTFNLITFSGDTNILFSEPVPATPENRRKAKKFLESRKSDGGTEMMKAIKAALEPSDSQHHVRIVCFMTDGQVGDDFSIISEIQKHKNARVFALGFGGAPNRFLLDKIAEYGRGEVEYVTETGDASAVSRRFNDRIRNPLLTDISVEWSGLTIDDIYPKNLPDLFSTKPVSLVGRYASGGKGTIRLKGMMAGQPFVREIPVELPESEPAHDVLATLWARSRIDHLMGQDMAGLQSGQMQQELREEITRLGLSYKLMTQFTSFVAIDDVMFTPGGEPTRVDVQVDSPTGSGIPSGVSATVMVTAGYANTLYSGEASLTTSITNRAIADLPLQGRSLNNLVSLAPGTVPTQVNNSVNGQRSSSNNLIIDGVSANFGITPGGQSPDASVSGTMPAVTATGGLNGLAAQSATQEMTTNTSYIQPEYGRVPGAQVSFVTQSGTNTFHGSLFEFFGNSIFDASDWFANSRGLNQPARHLNNFGGTFGGPIKKDKVFFFANYEGLRLRQPMTALSEVPTVAARLTAPIATRQFLEAYPIPNGRIGPNDFAEFAATFSNPASHDVASIRLDANPDSQHAISARYSFGDSAATQRGIGGLSLNTRNRIRSLSQTLTGSVTRTLSPSAVVELRANYSKLNVSGSYALDEFGGAAIPSMFGSASTFDLNARNGKLMTGNEVSNVQRQLNFVGSGTVISGTHNFKVGADYRRLSPVIGLRLVEQSVLFAGVDQSISGVADRVSVFHRSGPQLPVFHNFSMYAQDQWRKTSKFTLTYGLRWELNPAPRNEDSLAVDQIGDLSTMRLAPRGVPLWKTTYANFAPRIGFAYELSKKGDQELVLRGGVGVLYDIGQNRAGEAFSDSFPILTGSSVFNSPFPVGTLPAQIPGSMPFSAFDPNLRLPYTLSWNVSLQRALGPSQTISAGYVGSRGERLLNTQTLFDQNPTFSFIRLTTNGAYSDYRALQLQFDRHLSRNLSVLTSYTLSKSSDNASQDSAANVLMNSLGDLGPSDFDVRHVLSGLVTYGVPTFVQSGIGNSISRNWTVTSILNARSASPMNVVYGFPTSFGFGYLRPNVVDGEPFYLQDSSVGGGRRVNPRAFVLPSGSKQGNLGRNSLRGFPFYQIDLSLQRKFAFTESLALQFQVDAFNLLNRANFEDPLAIDLSLGTKFPAGSIQPNLTFGQSASLTGKSVLGGGGFGSLNSSGGSRTLRFSLKLMF